MTGSTSDFQEEETFGLRLKDRQGLAYVCILREATGHVGAGDPERTPWPPVLVEANGSAPRLDVQENAGE